MKVVLEETHKFDLRHRLHDTALEEYGTAAIEPVEYPETFSWGGGGYKINFADNHTPKTSSEYVPGDRMLGSSTEGREKSSLERGCGIPSFPVFSSASRPPLLAAATS